MNPKIGRRILLQATGGMAGVAGLGLFAGPARAESSQGVPAANHGTIGLVPLDDRPYTYWEPVQLARAAGYSAMTPPRELLGRHASPGDGAGIASWLTREAHRADALVVALPMLAFGGLLNSRNSSVSLAGAMSNLEAARKVRALRPRRRLFAFDTIMRLTPEGPWRNDLRAWATLVDEVDNLGMEAKRSQLTELEAKIPGGVREDYLATRARNHTVNLAMIEWAAAGVFDYLIIGQDDATGTGLHRPEALALRARIDSLAVSDRVVLYPGADVNAALLIARIALQDAGLSPTVAVDYSRLHGDDWTAPFQNIPHSQVVRAYVDTLGGSLVASATEANLVLMSNTGGSTASVEPFADRLVAHLVQGRTVILGDDAIAGRADYRLLPHLAGRMRLAQLAGYSGWNVGLSLSHAFVRFALERRLSRSHAFGSLDSSEAQLALDAASASVGLSLSEWIQTDSYRNHVRDATTKFASSLGEPDPQNIATHYEQINAYATSETTPYASDLFTKEFTGVSLRLGTPDGDALDATIGDVTQWGLYLPWLRTGEIAAEPTINMSLVR